MCRITRLLRRKNHIGFEVSRLTCIQPLLLQDDELHYSGSDTLHLRAHIRPRNTSVDWPNTSCREKYFWDCVDKAFLHLQYFSVHHYSMLLQRVLFKLTPHGGIFESCSASNVELCEASTGSDNIRIAKVLPRSTRIFQSTVTSLIQYRDVNLCWQYTLTWKTVRAEW